MTVTNTSLETNAFSRDYFDRFITPDEKRFDEAKQYINSVLVPETEKRYAYQGAQFRLLDLTKQKYRSVFLQNEDVEKELKDLEYQKKVAEEKARTDAIKNGLSLDEADRQAKEAGLVYKKRISSINFRQKPSVSQLLSNTTEELKLSDNSYNLAHNSYLSSDMELTGSLFSQTQLALNINMKMTQWFGLMVKEIKLKELAQAQCGNKIA